MAILPQTSPVPQPIPIFMPGTSPADAGPGPGPADPTPTSVPPIPEHRPHDADTDDQPQPSTTTTKDHPPFPAPKLRLEIRDLSHPGATVFLSAINASSVLSAAVANVQRLLYKRSRSSEPALNMPPTRSVTVILRDMGGVAYTTGSELDSDHKEIHCSLGYIAGVPTFRVRDELVGVLTHELVHCYQWNAKGSCPGGLIEGVADWVRLCCDLSPPHWKRETDGKWDRGYQHTAYFLEYLEGRFGEGTIRRLNEKLRLHRYEEKRFWTELLGRPVEQLWDDYAGAVGKPGATATTTSREIETVDEGTQT